MNSQKKSSVVRKLVIRKNQDHSKNQNKMQLAMFEPTKRLDKCEPPYTRLRKRMQVSYNSEVISVSVDEVKKNP